MPDLVLLDVRLYGEKSGIDVANYLLLNQLNIPYVYLTSQYDKRILEEALLTKPSGYLTKPIQKESLWTTIELAFHNYHSKSKGEPYISLSSGHELKKVREDQILFVESEHVYVKVKLEDGNEIISRSSLSQIFDLLNEEKFIQCHRSFVVNVHKIQEWSSSEIKICDNVIPISRSRKSDIKKVLKSMGV